MKNKNFILDVVPNGKSKVEIILKNKLSQIDTKTFLKKYKISNFFRGKFFIKRLIKKIFKHKSNNKLVWKNIFWENISIYKFDIDINFIDSNNKDDFEKKIVEDTLKNRMQDIYKYKNLLNNSIDLGYPLFIKGDALNYLGAKFEDDSYFILDGSRRLIANILCEKQPNILLIDIK